MKTNAPSNIRTILTLLAATVAVFVSNSASAAARTASVSGNWSSTATWGGLSVPVAGDTVTINTGITLTVDTNNAACTSVAIGTGAGTATLTFAASGSPQLTVSGAVTVGNNGNANRVGAITFTSGSTLICGSLTHGTTGSQASSINMTAGGTLQVGGAITVSSSGATFTPGSGTVILTANNTLPSATFTSFNILQINSGTTTLGVNLSILGNLTVNGGALDLSTFTANRSSAGGTLTVANGASLLVGGTANFPLNYTTYSLGATSTVDYNNGGSQTVSPRSYGNLIFSGSNAKSITNAATSVAGNLSIAPTGSATANIGAGLTINVGTLTMGGLGRNSGTYGGNTSGANFTNTTYFAATTGKVSISTDSRIAPVVTTWPTASAITYGQALSSSTLSGGSAPAGSFAFTLPSTIPSTTGAFAAEVVYSPTDTTAYNTTVTNNVNVTVNTKALTVTGVTASNKIYDRTFVATVDTSLASLNGIVSPDVVTLAGTAAGTFASSNVANGITVTVSGITLVGTDASKYTVTQPTTTANITVKSVTIASGIAGVNRTYNATTVATISSNSVVLSGIVSGDTITARTNGYSASFADKHIGTAKPITFSGMTLNGTGSGNYSLTQPSLTANVTTTNITVTARTNTKVYDGNTTATNTPNVTAGNLQTGDTLNFTEDYSTAAVGSGNKTLIPSGSVTDGNSGANYNVTLANFTTGTISARPLTVTGITATNKVYDRLTTATIDLSAAVMSGVILSEDATLNTNGATGAFSSNTVGNNKTVTISGLAVSGVDAANYSITAPTTTANITAATLTVSGGSVTSKTYNGNTTATINTSGMALVGLISPDTATLNTGSAAGTYDNKNVGTNKPVQISSLTISGGQSANYALTQPTNSGNITLRTLTVTANGVNKVYDGTTNATVTLTTNAVAGDVLTAAYTTAGFTDKNIGNNKTVNVSGISISGTDAANYTPNTTATTTANITGLPVQISGSRIYDGTTQIAGSALSVANSVDGANVSLTGTGILAARNVGSQSVSAGSTASRVQSTTGSVNNGTSISMTALNSTPVNGNTMIAVISSRGTAQNQVSSITQTGATWTRVVQSGASTANTSATEIWYAPNVSGAGTSITINLANSLRAAAVVMEYSGLLTASAIDSTNSNFANGTVSAAATTGTTPTTSQANELWIGGIAFTNSGYTLGSIQNSFSSVANVASTSGTAGNNINLYALERIVTATGTASSGGTISTASLWSGAIATFRSELASGSALALTGSASSNYTLVGMTGSATITAKALTTTGLTANNKAYDGNTTATLSGSAALLASETAGTGTTADGKPYSLDTVSISGTAAGSFADKNVGNTKPVSVSGLSLAGANAGNYSLTAPSLTANITAVSLTPSITANNKIYDGNNSATIATRSLSGAIGGDDVSLTGGTATFNNKNVANGKTVSATGLSLAGADIGNYSLASTSANTTADITARSLTVSASAQNKQYNGNTTAIVSFSDDRIGGDIFSASATAADFDTKDIGTAKPVSVSGISISGTDSGNYSLIATIAASSADITARPLTASATASNKVYDGNDSATIATRSLSGVVGAEDVTLSGGTVTFNNKNVGNGKAVAVVGMTLGGADMGNYSLASGNANTTADITAVSLTASATAANKVYDGNNSATIATRSLSGVIGSEDVTLSGGTATFNNKNVGNGKAVAVTGMILGGADMGNYSLTSGNANTTADITARSLTVSATAANKVYDGNDTASVTLSDDRIVGDVLSASHTSALFNNKNVGTAKPVSVSGISISGTDAGNYSLASTSAASSADITAVSLTASATANNKVYDGNDSATIATRSLSGVVGLEDVTLSGGTATFNNKNVGNGKAVAVVGMILGGADSANYSLASGDANTTADITGVSLTASVTLTNKIYDGGTNAIIVDRSVAGAIGGEDVSLTGGAANYDDKNVGTNKNVTITGLVLSGADAANYTLAASTLTSAADITERTLNVSATAANKTYDAVTSATVTLSDDHISGDAITTAHTSAAFADALVGAAKSVSVSGISMSGADAANYILGNTDTTATADITAALLTPSITAANKVYDGNNSANIASRSVTGIIGTEDVSLIGGTATFASINVGNGIAVNATGLSLSGADAGNYALTSTGAATAANISAASLTGSITAANKVYDGNDSATIATRTLSGVIGSEDVSLIGGVATFSDKQVANGKSVSATGLTLAGADAGNYILASGNAASTADITARSLTVSASASNKAYDGNDSATVSLSDDRISGDVLSASHTSALFDNKNVGTAKPVSVSGISISGADMGNYSLASTSAASSADITAVSLTASATANNKIYDGNNSATIATRSLSGVIGSEDVTLSGGTATFDNKNVGNGKAVAVVGMILGGADMANYSLTSGDANTTADITAVSLTASATANNKVYDGNDSATIATRSLTGVIGFEDVTLSGGTAIFDNKNVGNGKAVAIIGMTLGGADMANYSLASGDANTTADITAASLIASATANNKVYDGNNSATIATRSLTGIIGVEDVTLSGGTATFDNKNVGNGKAVAVVGMILGGADMGNYTLASGDANTTADITAVSLTANATANNKVYDGNDSATIATRSLSGVIGSEDVTLSGGTATFDNKNVGNGKAVAVTGMILGGADMANYTLTSGDANTTADITAVSLTASATAANKVYDGNDSATIATRSLSGVIGSEDVTLSGGTATFSDKNVGNGKAVAVTGMILGGADMANYSLASGDANTTADITVRSLVVSASASNKVYDGNDSAAVSLSDDRISGDILTTSHTSALFDNKNVGTAKPVSISGISISGTDSGNYNLSSTTASSSADITARSLIVSASASNKVYDGNNSATISLSDNHVAGDDITVSHTTAAFDDKNVGVAKPVSVSGISMSGADIGNYNLSSTTAGSSADITARSLTITASAQNKVYDGNTNAVASLADNRVSGDVLTTANTDQGFDDANVGTAKNVNILGLGISGADSGNYNLANTSATATADITPVQLTVTADNKSRAYGAANPTLTATITGFVNSETDSVISGNADLSTTADVNSLVSTYPISAALGSLSATNYTFNFVDGTLTITPYALTVSADNKARSYGAANPALTGSISGLQNGDNIAASYATVADANSAVGGYPITVSLADPDGKLVNYTVTTNEGTLTVNAALLTVTADDKNKVYGAANPALTSTITGFVNGENDSVITGSADISTAATANSPVGNQTITAALGTLSAANYSFTFVNGSLTISAAPLTAGATANNKVYDGNNSATIATRSLSGVIGSDDVSLSGGSASFDDKNVGNGKAVAIIGMTLGGADMANYSLASGDANTTADITAVSLTASATASNKVYDGNNSATILTRSLSGVIGSEDVTLSGGAATFDNKNVGNGKAVAVVGMVLGGADSANYTLASGNANTTADITAAMVTANVSVQNKVYDGTMSATVASSTLSGVIAPDDVIIATSSATFSDKNVGNNKDVNVTGVTLGGADAGNYTLAANTLMIQASITHASLNGSITASDKVYDGNTSASIATRSLDNVIGLDDVSLIGGTATFDNKNVGSGKAVSATGLSLSGVDAGNYNLVSGNANSTAAITAASLTASATAANKVYDGNNTATIATRSLSGVIGSEDVTLSGGTATFNNKNVGSSKAVAIIGMTLGGADSANYSLASGDANTTADITAASLTGSITAANKSYDGNNSATIASRSLTGVIGSEDVTLSGGTATFDNKNVGSGKTVSASGLSLTGADIANYSLASTSATTTANITAIALSVTANDASRNYGEANPSFTGALTGMVAGDNITASYSTTANAASPAGTYAITPSLNDPDNNLGNYTVTINNGTLTIISLTPSTITSIEKQLDGSMKIIVNGTPGQAYKLQATETLDSTTWSDLSTATADGSGTAEFNDNDAPNHVSRFYRISTP